MKLIVGLGNPGEKYSSTRHNIGFIVADEIASRHGISFADKKRCLLGKGCIGDKDITLVKPQTYMNLSGEAVRPVFSYANTEIEDLIVIHDEIDLEFGKTRIKVGGGHGGHNGLKSVISHLGDSGFIRVRCGVGRPETGGDVSKYVLSPFSPEEKKKLWDIIEYSADAVEAVVRDGAKAAMNRYN